LSGGDEVALGKKRCFFNCCPRTEECLPRQRDQFGQVRGNGCRPNKASRGREAFARKPERKGRRCGERKGSFHRSQRRPTARIRRTMTTVGWGETVDGWPPRHRKKGIKGKDYVTSTKGSKDENMTLEREHTGGKGRTSKVRLQKGPESPCPEKSSKRVWRNRSKTRLTQETTTGRKDSGQRRIFEEL